MTQTPNQDARAIDERLSEYRELLSQFEAVRGRLRRAEEERQSVPRRVYEKVRAEYDRQLDALRSRMTPMREEIDRYRDQFETQLKEASSAVETIEEELAEVTFRHRIGEYADDVAAAARRDIEARLAAARARIEGVRETLAAMTAPAPVFEATAAAETEPAAPAPRETVPVRPATAPASEAPRETLRSAPRPTVPPPAQDVPADAEPAPAPPAAARPVEPAAEPATPAAEPATAKRPVLRPGNLSEPARTGFENPHDWIDEFGRDQKRRETDTAPAAHPAAGARASHAAPASPPPSLVFVSGPHAGQSIPLLQTTLTIGREHDNNIEIKDLDVARYHARILNERGEYVVEDMSSTTGTWVNGVRTQRAALGHGDVIRIGQTEIAVDFEWASNSLERASVDPSA